MVERQMKLGLSLPLFLGSLFSLFIGIFVGIIGIWGYLAWKLPVPEFIKVGHAHVCWWSVLLVLASFLLPSIALRPWVRRFILCTSFLAIPLWMMLFSVYYTVQEVSGIKGPLATIAMGGGIHWGLFLLGTIIFLLEAWFFGAILIIFLNASGIKILTTDKPVKSQLDIITDIDCPKKIFTMPLIFAIMGIGIGWLMVLKFKAYGIAIGPAALVQLHSHIFFFLVGYLLTLMTMRAIGTKEEIFEFTYKLGLAMLPTIVIGWYLFIFFRMHSLAHIIPSLLYFLIMVFGLLSLFGKFGLQGQRGMYFNYTRGAMIFTWIFLIIVVLVGPIISLVWDTDPNITVTYKQPEGISYPGPYPEEYIGSAPSAHTPRGLENLHLSPGSWAHAALFWLLALLLVGEKMGKILLRPTLIFLILTTIPMAPLFNAIGRIGAWTNLPSGAGGLWFAGHPLKFFNVITLVIIILSMIRRLRLSSPYSD